MPEDFDLASYLRRRRVGGGSLFEPSQSSTTIVEPGGAQLPQPQYPAFEEYRKFLEGEPQIKDYHPGKLRQVLAGIAGVGEGVSAGPKAGLAAGEAVKYAPFKRKMREFEQSAGMRERAAGLEATGAKLAGEESVRKARISELGARQTREERQSRALPGSYEEQVSGQERIRRAGVRPVGPPRPINLGPGHEAFDPVTGKKIAGVPPLPQKVQIDPKELENLRQQHRIELERERARLRPPKQQTQRRGPSVASQAAAEKLAAKHIYETMPEYKDLIDPKTFTIKSPEEPGFFSGVFGTTRPEEAKEKHKRLTLMRDDLARQILSKQQSQPAGSVVAGEDEADPYEIEEDEEDQ